MFWIAAGVANKFCSGPYSRHEFERGPGLDFGHQRF